MSILALEPHPQSSISSPTEFKIRYWWSACAQPPSISDGLLMKRVNPCTRPSWDCCCQGNSCMLASWNTKNGLKQDVVVHTAHSHSKKKKKSMKPYTNACCGSTLPAALHICASTPTVCWDGESSSKGGEDSLPHGQRERHRSQR